MLKLTEWKQRLMSLKFSSSLKMLQNNLFLKKLKQVGIHPITIVIKSQIIREAFYMTLKILRASTIAFILFTGCTLLGKKTERTPQGGIKSAFKLFVKAGNEAAKALRKGEKNMEGENLQGAHLQNLDLTDVNVKNADLEGARLQGTVWDNAKAQGANFTKARLQGASFHGTTLREAKAVLVVKAIFRKARLQKAGISNLDLRDLDFRGAKLTEAYLQRSNLARADFRGANLKGTKLQNARVRGADFREAKNLDEAQWKGAEYSLRTKFPEDFNPKKHGLILHLEGADLRGQYIGDLDLENATFWWKANLEGATYKLGQKFPEGFNPIEKGMVLDVKKSNMERENRDFTGVNFWNADMRDIFGQGRFSPGILYGADLSRMTNVTNLPAPGKTDWLKGARYDLDTKFPEGFEPQAYDMKLDISKMDLRNVDLKTVDLKGADFGDVDLTDVDLRGKDLHGAKLTHVKNVEKAQLEGAYWDYDTRFPLGYDPPDSDQEFKKFLWENKLILDLREKDLRNSLTTVEGGKGQWAGQAEAMHDLWANHRSGPISVDFDRADLRGLSRNQADFGNALNLHRARLEGATYSRWTIFPEGFNPEEHGMRLVEEATYSR